MIAQDHLLDLEVFYPCLSVTLGSLWHSLRMKFYSGLAGRAQQHVGGNLERVSNKHNWW